MSFGCLSTILGENDYRFDVLQFEFFRYILIIKSSLLFFGLLLIVTIASFSVNA